MWTQRCSKVSDLLWNFVSLFKLIGYWLQVFVCDYLYWGAIVAGDVGSVYFGPNHPMKPHRLCMTHHLVLAYDLHKKMEIYVSCLFNFFLSFLNSYSDLFWWNMEFSHFLLKYAATPQGLPSGTRSIPFGWVCWIFASDNTGHSTFVRTWTT